MNNGNKAQKRCLFLLLPVLAIAECLLAHNIQIGLKGATAAVSM